MPPSQRAMDYYKFSNIEEIFIERLLCCVHNSEQNEVLLPGTLQKSQLNPTMIQRCLHRRVGAGVREKSILLEKKRKFCDLKGEQQVEKSIGEVRIACAKGQKHGADRIRPKSLVETKRAEQCWGGREEGMRRGSREQSSVQEGGRDYIIKDFIAG